MTPIPVQNSADETGREHAATSSESVLSTKMLSIIHGDDQTVDKKAEYEASLRRWWGEYADRKNDEEDEYVANSLLYDRNHLPRTAPAPDCCQEDAKPGHGGADGDGEGDGNVQQ
jgi:hypothetical protein